MNGSRGSTFLNETFLNKKGRIKGASFIFIALGIFISAASYGSERSSNLGISITIAPEVEISQLPVAVQRLDAVIPGYGNLWSQAREITRTNPVGAIRFMRAVHVQNLGETAQTAVIEADMIAAGQALFADAAVREQLAAKTGSLAIAN